MSHLSLCPINSGEVSERVKTVLCFCEQELGHRDLSSPCAFRYGSPEGVGDPTE